jgi:hypothetical protein
MSFFELVTDPTTSEKAPILIFRPAALSSLAVLDEYWMLSKPHYRVLGGGSNTITISRMSGGSCKDDQAHVKLPQPQK